ncbi:MAG: Gfo/Idh/MocA family oxidoreductase [Pirellulales bacterium]|nr:Gfo/Idh/MocA family oxidoreductase [Pirellulales bacterium]
MKLRVGVVGIGNAWESRHQPALRALSDRFEVTAVCDPVRHLAEQVSRQFNATVHDGFRALTRRTDIDGVLVLSANFFGATPIYAACDAGKAVYCAAAIEMEDEQAASLRQRVEESGIAFMAEFPFRLSPATLRLKELIATKLGEPRLLFCNRRRTMAPASEKRDRCGRDLVELVDWCRYVVGTEPTSLLASGHQNTPGFQQDYLSVSLDFSPEGQTGSGPLANISCGHYVQEGLQESLSYRRPADLKIVCERGIAFVDFPNTVAWFDEAGQHLETLDHERPVGELLLLHFHRAIESLVLKSSSLADAHRAILIANHAKLSYQTGQRVAC